jgi:hypothetical protein
VTVRDRSLSGLMAASGPALLAWPVLGTARAGSALIEEVFVDALDHVGVLVLDANVVLDHQAA